MRCARVCLITFTLILGIGISIFTIYSCTFAQAPLTFIVNTTIDSHDNNIGDGICQDSLSQCSLRAAIEESNECKGSDIVQIPSGNYLLNYGQIPISDSITINGAGKVSTVINGNDIDRILIVDKSGSAQSIDVEIYNVSLVNGNYNGSGGALWNDENLTLNNVVINNNKANHCGGGIFSKEGILYISNSEISYNHVIGASDFISGSVPEGGGGIYIFQGNLYITNTSLISNTFTGISEFGNKGGAAIAIGKGELFCKQCLLKNNKTTNKYGWSYGAVSGWDSNIYIENSRIEGNESHSDEFTAFKFGGGVHIDNGKATISSSEFISNTAQSGSAISSYWSTLTISHTLIKGNKQEEIAIFLYHGVENNLLSDSIITENELDGNSIIGVAESNIITITRTTISNNTHSDGIFNSGKMYIQNSTISGNTTNNPGNVCGNLRNNGTLEISHSTISNNDSIAHSDICTRFPVTFTNSIIDTSCWDNGLGGNFISKGHNLITDNRFCNIISEAGDIMNIDPNLKPLGNYGSQMPTHALESTSPAINSGTCFDSYGILVLTDQRGVERDSSCDIGSYEFKWIHNYLPLILKQ